MNAEKRLEGRNRHGFGQITIMWMGSAWGLTLIRKKVSQTPGMQWPSSVVQSLWKDKDIKTGANRSCTSGGYVSSRHLTDQSNAFKPMGVVERNL